MKRFALPLLLAFAAGAQASIVSDFSTGVDGWTTTRVNPYTQTVVSSGGAPGWNPAGYLDTFETSGDLFLYSAAPKFLGAKDAFFGGSVSFDLSDATSDSGDTLGFFLVSADQSVSLGYAVAPPATSYPGTPYSVPLSQDGNWYRYAKVNGVAVPLVATNTDILTALTDLGFMGVNADFTTTTIDHTTLDNVVMAVPEPAPLAALALSLLVLRRRRATAL